MTLSLYVPCSGQQFAGLGSCDTVSLCSLFWTTVCCPRLWEKNKALEVVPQPRGRPQAFYQEFRGCKRPQITNLQQIKIKDRVQPVRVQSAPFSLHIKFLLAYSRPIDCTYFTDWTHFVCLVPLIKQCCRAEAARSRIFI